MIFDRNKDDGVGDESGRSELSDPSGYEYDRRRDTEGDSSSAGINIQGRSNPTITIKPMVKYIILPIAVFRLQKNRMNLFFIVEILNEIIMK